ncbi:hypothetical protein WJX72_002766 [[Myrmecia] bisecta]|uniref:cellulase n=1 Tax=[Myrmecia] bisecta TaxID=41462 RepID=A0AAW1R5K5_9CHLO
MAEPTQPQGHKQYDDLRSPAPAESEAGSLEVVNPVSDYYDQDVDPAKQDDLHPDTFANEEALQGASGMAYRKRDGLGSLVRLVEALDMYDGAGTEYSDDCSVDSRLLGPGKRKIHSALLSTYGEMNPKLRGKQFPTLEEEDQEEVFTAAPFHYNAPEVAPPMGRDPEFGGKGSGEGDGEDDESDEGPPVKRYQRRRHFNWVGILFFVFFLCAFGFYLWVRITKTLNLGAYTWYGILVLVVECLGASTTFTYGLHLLMDPEPNIPPPDADNPGLTKSEHPYHVRVLVPCYKESLEIVGRTIQAAYNAALPEGCARTIYLLDDGKDAQKRKWCQQMGPEIVYVSGRQRAVGEMNGKSCNLNNCLNQIYPPGVPVPPTELVCIFDADQVCNVDFFLKTVPLFDAGDDVGMVLSPQCFNNVNHEADIFNHGNVQFWEYAQHGYDAMGFISCTGTNFLTRSTAFQESGWSPEYTLTEDYALGMELMKRKWQCRYVEEYLAIGEAPEQVRNCFQQRSRWCKGHFQIVLSNEHCPLFQKELSWFMRFMFCSGVWSYIVGAITTPMFIAIPLVTIWAGVFPIVVSWWAAVALTANMLAQYLVLNYCRKRAHWKPLWFANVANNILWFAFVKACFRAVGASCGKSITFKTTLKGSGRLLNSAMGDIWMPAICFLALAASFGFGLHKVITGPSVITTLSISIVWIVYGMIAPYLLLHYHFIGRGGTLRFACKLLFWVSGLCGLVAILLLWLVYPPQYDYSDVLQKSFLFYDSQRVGQLPADFRIPWRGDSLLQQRGFNGTVLSGGFMNGGDAGTLEMTIPTAFSTSLLAWGMLAFPEGYNKSQQVPFAKDTLRWGTDYLLKLYALDSAKTTKFSTEYNIIYQVGNYTQDKGYWGRPENMTGPRPTYYISTVNGTSDLVGQLVGALVSTAMVFQTDDPDYYDKLMGAALDLYGAGTRHRAKYTGQYIYNCAPPAAGSTILNKPVDNSCPPPDEVFRGAMVFQYNSTSYRDDLAWAASWLYKATNDKAYLTDAYRWWEEHVQREGDFDAHWLYDWDNMIHATTILLADLTDDMPFHYSAQTFLRNWLCTSGATIAYTEAGRAYNSFSPSQGTTMNAAFLSIVYGQLIASEPDPTQRQLEVTKYHDDTLSQRYVCWTRKQMRYMLGDPGTSMVVGFNNKYPTHIQDRASACPSPPAACSILNSYYSPNPNPHVLEGALVMGGGTTDAFQDVRSVNDTQVSIEWQSGLTGSLAGLNQAAGTYDQCLQGFGIFAKDKLVCAAGT